MYVVRIENDEASMFRTFARWADAKGWALSRAGFGAEDELIDIYSLQGFADPIRAVEAVRDGFGNLVTNGERLMAENIRQSSTFLAGIGLGNGAGF